ncbi:MAG TPA: NAD-dependent epimerase/dehydratase family protein [Abditibacteriaceae bacterium]|nr:NAD-dependent epimerase/dehydratase family protein [Abditibacteriaceae bacterium]
MDGDIEATMQNTHSSNGQRQSGQDRNGQHRNGQAQHDNRPTLITGGAGFVGTNLAHRLLSQGQRVLVFDNLSRAGVERNLRWLRETHGDLLQVEVADVRDVRAVQRAVERSSSVFHFAAQVAVTTSLIAPIEDFEINARGTLNVLEANRVLDAPIPLVFTSTNKVYGGLDDVALSLQNNRYEPADNHLRAHGISEARALDFHSPYGCSKGCADQYVLDYARTFDIPAVVLRMSCIYGPHQCGNEDQGWVAHFLLRALESEPITLFGDGKQVRDALFVDDLLDAFLTARQQIDQLSGQAFNIGGGAHNTTSLLQLIEAIGELHGQSPQVEFSDWRVGDQRYYVSDVAKFASATGWKPRVDVQSGVAHLYRWLRENVRENAVA